MKISPDKELIEFFDANSIDEDVVIKDLLTSSKKFKLFFKNEVEPLEITRDWIDNNLLEKTGSFSSLPDGVLAAGAKLDTNKWVIVVRNVPALLTDETVIAHELAHIKIESELFPLTNIDPKFCNRKEMDFFLASLNNLIHDPLVIMKLKSYGYDLRREYIYECQEGIKFLQNTFDQPTGIEEIKFVFDYVKNTLENEILFGNSNNACKRYNEILGQKFGSVKIKGEALRKMILEIGFDSPDKVRRIYEIVIERFGLSKLIILDQ